MNWLEQVDNYCERTDLSFWAEPANAASNLSFLLFAWLAWRMLEGRKDRDSRGLTILLAVIGLGSFLFHTFATLWAELADVLPITAFIVFYLYFGIRRFLELPRWAGAIAVLGFFPYAIGFAWVINQGIGPLNGSVGYLPVVLLITAFSIVMIPRNRDTAAGLATGALLLTISLFFRSIDMGVCPGFPIGTHFVWHLLNGAMLGLMIRVLHRYQTA